MTTIRTVIRVAAITVTTASLVMMGTQYASAATSNKIVYHPEGTMAGEVWFNSGNHAPHSVDDGEKYGFNSFTLKDHSCGDGWGMGVEWQFNGQTYTYRGTEDCLPDSPEVTYETGQASNIITEFAWRPFKWAVDEPHDPQYGAWQSDWMGSNSVDIGDRYFTRTSVHNDVLPNGRQTFTATMWPTELARLTVDAAAAMWRDLVERTPLPSSLTKDQLGSLYDQLWCHAEFGRHPEFGGETWEIESERPNLPLWQLVTEGVAKKCNW